MKHLLFFGKSQSFTFKAYDETGPIGNYSHFIQDFDRLESIVFTIDAVDNGEIVGRYRFTHAGKKHTLLKMYSYAQAFSGYRVEGSTYGVAFLSDMDIAITDRNIKLLQSLLNSFAQLSLNGKKFRYEDFSNDSTRIWQGFKNQLFFDKIDFCEEKPRTLNTNPAGIQVNDLTRISQEVQSISDGRSVVYLTTDRPHLERAKNKWDKYFDIFLIDDQRYVMNPSERSAVTGLDLLSNTNSSKSDVQSSDKRTPDSEDKYRDVKPSKKRNRNVLIIGVFVFLLLMMLLIVLFPFYEDIFRDLGKTDTSLPPKEPVVILAPEVKNNASSKSIDEETLVWVLTRFDSLKKADNTRKPRLMRDILIRLQEAGVDTNKLRSIIK
jgi:hypothetical protein